MQVIEEGGGYTVTHDGQSFRVLRSETFGWCVYTGADLARVGSGYATADAACAAIPTLLAGAR